MYRNDTLIPFFSLLFAAGLLLITYFSVQHVARLQEHALEELTVGQIGLMSFAIIFLLYGVMGFLSVWLEGQELRPKHRLAEPGKTHIGGIILTVFAVALSGLFMQAIRYSLATGENHPAIEGILFGLISLVIAALLTLYKRFFQDEEVRIESAETEVPW